MKTITITIDPVGRPTVEAHGFKGVGCKAATKPILDALSGAAKDTVKTVEKDEIHLPEPAGEHLHLRA